MKIVVENLEAEGYHHLSTLEHKNIANFLKPYLFKLNRYVVIYNVASFLPLIVFGFIIGLKLGNETFDADIFMYFFLGFSFTFLMIPLHEYIHGFAYNILGARKVSYGADIRKFVFYALADKFVANSKEFQIIALAPFTIITTTATILFFLLPVDWSYTMLGILFLHSLCCGGDFGLLSYLYENKDKQIVTYDDVAEKASYFYEKSK